MAAQCNTPRVAEVQRSYLQKKGRWLDYARLYMIFDVFKGDMKGLSNNIGHLTETPERLESSFERCK